MADGSHIELSMPDWLLAGSLHTHNAGCGQQRHLGEEHSLQTNTCSRWQHEHRHLTCPHLQTTRLQPPFFST